MPLRAIFGARRGRDHAALRANGPTRRIVWTNARYNAHVKDGGQSKRCAGRNCGSYCGAHRLPAGRTAARGESRRASCRSGRKAVRRSTTATVQGICPFRENMRILVTTLAQSQRFLRRFFFRFRYLWLDANRFALLFELHLRSGDCSACCVTYGQRREHPCAGLESLQRGMATALDAAFFKRLSTVGIFCLCVHERRA